MTNLMHGSSSNRNAPDRPVCQRDGARGVALITTLLLLTLLVAMTLSMTISVTSDTLISRYYRNSRSSFYAADSGINIARQYMMNQLSSNAVAVGATFASTGTPPLSATDSTTTITNLLAAYGSGGTASQQVNSGQGASSWPGTFYVVQTQTGTVGTTLGTPGCASVSYTGTPTNTAPYTCTNLPACTGTCAGFGITVKYTTPYTITAIGQSLANEQQVVQDSGTLTLNINAGSATATTTSFAAWGMFIDQYSPCDGSSLVPGTITGPTFTNGTWNFGTSGTYTFTDKVGSVGSSFGYQFTNCYTSANPSYTSGGSTIAPSFQGGYQLGANAVALPTNSYSQEDAVLDGLGTTTPTQAAEHSDLRNAAATQYPATGTPTSGVYMSYTQTTSGSTTTNTMAGGGILVQGDATSVTLAATTAPSTGRLTGTNTGDALQVFTIVQGSTTTTITIDQTTNNTIMQQSGSSTPLLIAGVPEIKTGATPSDATMLYVNGNIDSLTGQSAGADVQNGAAITITAADNITVTGNITYATEPVTMTQNQVVSGVTYPIADTLIPANNNGQVLGIFTAGGNVNLAVPTNNQNLEIDASIATISSGGSGAIINNGNSINTLNIVGGRIQNTIQSIGATTRNVFFDRRFASGNFAPPWFPSTVVTPTASDSVTSVTTSVQRTQWVNSSVQ